MCESLHFVCLCKFVQFADRLFKPLCNDYKKKSVTGYSQYILVKCLYFFVLLTAERNRKKRPEYAAVFLKKKIQGFAFIQSPNL
jgi:hypothetical protein